MQSGPDDRGGGPLGDEAGFEEAGFGDTLRDLLRRVLADPDLEIVYPRVGSGGWVTELRNDRTEIGRIEDRAFTAIDRGGKPVAGLLHDPALLDDAERLRVAIDAASLAIDHERLKAQLRAQLLEVQESRARIVDAGDRELRRVERNLHDGAQQRLVGLALTLRMASRTAAGDAAVTNLLADAARELEDALRELRDLARGIHPAIVHDAGLAGALESLAETPGVPVELFLDLPGRLPEPLELGAYFLVGEALANVNKHAGATHATVRATASGGVLRMTVADDGRGGARAGRGSGLQGLTDRVTALGGHLEIDSPLGQGTVLSAEIPLSLTPVIDLDLERRRMTALTWIGWDNWEAPAELYEQITQEDNLAAAKVILLCAGGNAQLTHREREWLIGYLTAAGDADWVIEAVRSYDDADTLEDLMQVPGIPSIVRAMLYDAMRMCASDGPLTAAELDRLHDAARATGIDRELVSELHAVVLAEQALRDRRYELVLAPLLPVESALRH